MPTCSPRPHPARPSQRGPRACKGHRLPKLTAVLANPATRWTRVWVSEWYGEESRVLEIVSATAIWYHAGLPPAPIRWMLVRDPSGRREPQAFLSTSLDDKPEAILGRFVWRWRIDHVPGWSRKADPPPSSRRRDPGAVVQPGHSPDHAGAARTVLAGDAVGRRPDGRCRHRAAPT